MTKVEVFAWAQAMDESEMTDPTNGEIERAAHGQNMTIDADPAATFTFASHQNSIPVIRIEDSTADSVEAGLF